MMGKQRFTTILILLGCLAFTISAAFGQTGTQNYSKSQEVSEADGVPVIIKHLPDYENARNRAAFITNSDELKAALGDRPVFNLIDFTSGTEAVAAPYDAGNLLIVEYMTPQASTDADQKITQRLNELGGNSQIFYRRIGNYNVFLFDATDESAAGELFDQIKYEKIVQWLGEDPTIYQRAERFFVQRTSEVFVATVFAILTGIGFAIVSGLVVGLVFFKMREQKRAGMSEFSDAGGMTRLNLDEFTPKADRLLNK